MVLQLLFVQWKHKGQMEGTDRGLFWVGVTSLRRRVRHRWDLQPLQGGEIYLRRIALAPLNTSIHKHIHIYIYIRTNLCVYTCDIRSQTKPVPTYIMNAAFASPGTVTGVIPSKSRALNIHGALEQTRSAGSPALCKAAN